MILMHQSEQRAHNSAALLTNRVRRRDQMTPILQPQHWLSIKMRITFQICKYMCMCVHGLVPDYLNCAIVRNAPILAFRSSRDGIDTCREMVGVDEKNEKGQLCSAGSTMWSSKQWKSHENKNVIHFWQCCIYVCLCGSAQPERHAE